MHGRALSKGRERSKFGRTRREQLPFPHCPQESSCFRARREGRLPSWRAGRGPPGLEAAAQSKGGQPTPGL